MVPRCQTNRNLMILRDALPSDAEIGAEVLRRSIRELCAADHGGSEAELAVWLANKTPESFAAWAQTPGMSLLVVESDRSIAGVGLIGDSGEIFLLYVSPDARFQGVSKALLQGLEQRAVSRGVESTFLNSTETALRFYLAAGYRPHEVDGATRRLSKRLTKIQGH